MDTDEVEPAGSSNEVHVASNRGLVTILREWRLHIIQNEQELITVSRDPSLCFKKAMQLFRRTSFQPSKTLKVTFRGEEGEDGGGLLRDFFELTLKSMADSHYFESTAEGLEVSNDKVAVVNGTFRALGRLVAAALLQGGPVRPMFSHQMVGYGAEGPRAASVEGFPPHIRMIVDKIKQGDDDSDVQDFLAADNIGVQLNGNTRATVIAAICAFHGPKHAQFDEFWQGAELLGLRTLLEKHREQLEGVLCSKCGISCDPSAQQLISLLLVHDDGEKGSNARRLSDKAIDQFEYFIRNCEDQLVEGPEGAEQLTVGSVLHFLTGTSTIPPRGFSSSIHVYFSNEKYPVVSTCVPQIVVPTGHTDVELQNILRESVIGAAGYGRT